MKYTIGAIAAVLTALTIGTGTANADESSFINYMRSHGQAIFPGVEPAWIAGGYQICNTIKTSGRDAALNIVQPMWGRDPETYVFAAQHELCPETL